MLADQLDAVAFDLQAGHAHPVLSIGDNGQTMLVCGVNHRMDVGLADAIVALSGEPAFLIWRQIAEVVGCPEEILRYYGPGPADTGNQTSASGPLE